MTTSTIEQSRQALHDLRNHLNSIAMQAEVLKLYIAEGNTEDSAVAAENVINICRKGGELLGVLSENLTSDLAAQ